MNIFQGKDGNEGDGGPTENLTGEILRNQNFQLAPDKNFQLAPDKNFQLAPDNKLGSGFGRIVRPEVSENFGDEILGKLARLKQNRDMEKSLSEVGLSASQWMDSKSSKTGGFGGVSPFMPEYPPSKTQEVFGARNPGAGYHKQNLTIAKADTSTELPDWNLLNSGYGGKTPRRPAEYKS